MSSLRRSTNQSLRSAPETCRRPPARSVGRARARPRKESRPTTTTTHSSSSDPSPSRPRPTKVEVRVCTNKTCRRQGSEAIAKLSSDLSLPGVETKRCGCLGVCGSGPNVAFVFLDDDGRRSGKAKRKDDGVVASHVSTPARFLSALETAAGISVSPELLRATTARLRGNELARAGDLRGAEAVYTSALDGASDGDGEGRHAPAPAGARHLLLSNRSGVRLALGDATGALSDAEAAVAEAPEGWGTALVRLSEARAALGDGRGAEEALRLARETDRTVDEALRRRR